MKKIVFTGGGTLGHVMPNLYLIDELKSDYEIEYIGSEGIERDEITKRNIKYHTIPTIKLVRGKIFQNLKIPFVLLKSVSKAKKILKEIKPDIIFSKGGYVSLPVCIAGKMLKIPIVAHESDYNFGLANKIILKLCDKMCVNFRHLEKKNKKIVYTGPIFSREFEKTDRLKGDLTIYSNLPTMLVVGGSLGSKKINDLLLPIVKDLITKFNIIHVTGKGNIKLKSFDNYNSLELSDDMVNLYNLSDFVIGRSGAGVSAECFYKKLPMMLIPLENRATRGDQLLNAKYYEDQQVAKILKESDLTPTKLYDEIIDFSNKLNQYRTAYKGIDIVNGREKVIYIIKNSHIVDKKA